MKATVIIKINVKKKKIIIMIIIGGFEPATSIYG